MDTQNQIKFLDKVREIKNSGCQRCPDLASIRTNIVVGKGNQNADTLIIAQGPGTQEDQQGLPFVGPAGKLLHSIISAAGYNSENDFYFSNVTYCHTPGNSKPTSVHLQNCSSYVRTVTAPFKKIVALGASAVEGVLAIWGKEYLAKASLSMGNILTRGTPLELSSGKVLFICYHPSFLLRNQMTGPQFDEYNLLLNEIKQAKAYNKDLTNKNVKTENQVLKFFSSGEDISLF
jgi:uracil-DNA glycosylase family 4